MVKTEGWGMGGCYLPLVIEAMDSAAKHPISHRTSPIARNYLAKIFKLPTLRNATLTLLSHLEDRLSFKLC